MGFEPIPATTRDVPTNGISTTRDVPAQTRNLSWNRNREYLSTQESVDHFASSAMC